MIETRTPIQKEFYGDDSRWFLATVINSRPPSGLEGRVKIRIIGIHNDSITEIPESDLPWAQVLIPTTEGGISGIGRIPQLLPGALVFGMFLDGISSQIPLVLGSLPRIEKPTAIQGGRLTTSANSYNYNQTRNQNVVSFKLQDDDLAEGEINLRRQQAVKFFIDNGYELIHAASVAGALQATSSFKTYVEEVVDDSSTIGIAKWKKSINAGSRYAELLRFARDYQPALSWKLFSIQLEFVVFELRNRFASVNAKLVATKNVKAASEVINLSYLKNTNRSEIIAQQAYEEVIS
jgi:hypothetical protein